MKTYEALILFKPFLDTENPESSLKAVEAAIQKLKGKVLKTDKGGRRRLAYEINKFKDAFVATVYFELAPEKVAEFRKACHFNEEVMRIMILHRENIEEAMNAEPAPAPRGRGRSASR